MNTTPFMFQGSTYTTKWSLVDKATDLAIPLPGTYTATIWKNDVVIITATLANTKLSAVNSAGGFVTFNLTTTDTASLGSGYGMVKLTRTDVGPSELFRQPVRFLSPGDTVPADVDGTVVMDILEIKLTIEAGVGVPTLVVVDDAIQALADDVYAKSLSLHLLLP